LATDAVIAFQACSKERYHDFVADFEFANRISLLDNLADKFMSADEVRGALEVATVKVQVTATESGTCDFEDGIGGFLDLGIWAVFYRDLGNCSVPGSVLLGEWNRYLVVALQDNGSHC
jgi:hypothetical protein